MVNPLIQGEYRIRDVQNSYQIAFEATRGAKAFGVSFPSFFYDLGDQVLSSVCLCLEEHRC